MKRIAGGLARLILLPLYLVVGAARLLWAGLRVALGPVLRRVDRSPRFGGVITALSSSMAPQRGVPLLVGAGLVVLSFGISGLLVILLVETGHFDSGLYWLCIPAALLHLGVLTGFVGIMLAVPLGQGYRDR